ncbi:hypothetical protein GGR21_003095 [Dysgonomonas hofstadii]|uniref:DUF4412 domain-containing protein n=1 Tax=Dysgonomonas hofstadii TaxID=637886 RepID=A0A840CMF9_9BACT|nr:hypothetical protein [Dysgonomonas hofstadii]MBB4037180.1 hypothetical protein [Dysgonomonas hofstadii]
MKRVSMIAALLFCIIVSTQAQVKYSFISMKEKYTLNLPQFDMSIPLPAKAGFRTPQISDKKVMFEIDTETVYCFDLDKIGEEEGAGLFSFSVPDCNEYYLYMEISRLPIASFYKKKRELALQSGIKQLPALKTKLNKETYSISENSIDYHYIHHEDFLFSFYMKTEAPEKIKKQYQNIIRNIQSKDLRNQLRKYEDRIKYGYFDKKKDTYDPELYKFLVWEGVREKQSTYTWDVFDIQATIPAGWNYRVNGRQMRESGDESGIRIVMDSLDLYDNPMMMTWFRSDSLTFTIRSYTKASNVNMEDMIKHMASMVSYSVQKTINIDGIAMPVTLYGTEEMATIDTYYEANGITHWLSFGGVTAQTMPLADRILSSIKIDQPQLKDRASGNVCNTLGGCFGMKKAKPVQLDVPLEIPYIDESKTMLCMLPNVKMKLRILGPDNQWYCSVGSDRVEMKDGVVEAVPVNNSDKRLTIYSMSPEGVYYNISKLQDSPMDRKTYTENFKRGFSSYKMITVLHASVTSVNGKPWSICIYKQNDQYMGMFVAANSEYEMHIAATGTSYEEIVGKAGYIRLVEFSDSVLP